MKVKIKLLIVLTLALFYLSGCFSSGSKAVPYSFTGDIAENSAVLTFGHGVAFVDFEGQGFSEGSSYSSSIALPAGRAMDLRVYVFWSGNSTGNRRRGIFKCPPLEAGREYRLSFNYRTRGIFVEIPIDGYSIVLERKKERMTLITSQYETVITQVIPPLPKK